jgi:hypothetical protein
MVFKNIPLTKADFDILRWEQIINACNEKECTSYMDKFFAKAKEMETSGNDKAQEIYNLLGAICSFHFNPENKDVPFGPMLVMNTRRSAIIDDISDEHLGTLQEIISDIKDHEIHARIADVIWLKKKDFKAAGVAIDSYLESATNLKDHQWGLPCFQRIERAYRLATQLGRRAGYRDKVVQHIEKLLDKYDRKDPLFLSSRLMELLLEQRQGDPSKYAILAGKIANAAESEGNYYWARTYWEIKARWDKLLGDISTQKSSEILAAETFVKEAETANSSLVAATWLQKAIEAFRRIGDQQQRVDEIHSKLVEIQKNVPSEMKTFSQTMNITEMVERYREHFKGKKLQDALFEFCLMGTSPSVQKLKEKVENSVRKHPFQLLVSRVIVNDKGKVTGKMPNMMSSDPEEVDRAKKAEMYSQARFDQDFIAQSLIKPVRHQIISEHNVQIRDFYPIVKNSPFVPEDREQLFAQGLHAGLTGNYLMATHLLIPQVENSIRYLLEQRGVTVSKLDDEGVQDEIPLNAILDFPEVDEMFGEDLVFDLRGLLVERYGSNLRNRVAHGLMSFDGFYSFETAYFWWITLRLCCIPIITHLKDDQQKPSPTTSDEKG